MMHRFELEGIHDRGSRDCDCLPGWRARTCQNLLSGLSCRPAAIRFGLSASSAIRGRRMERVQGGAMPKAVLARPALDAWTVMRVPIRALVDETPDITLEELRTALAARHLWQAT